jgi:acyl-CoA thioester hydrolase
MNTENPGPVDAAEYGVLMPTHVYFDDLDPFGMLHNGRYTVLAERAWNTYWETRAQAQAGVGDAFNVVKESHITYDTPITRSGSYAVHLWVERLGRTSVTWGFRLCSRDEATTYAHGTRVNIHLDTETLMPAPWSEQTRALVEKIKRPNDQPA